MKRLFYLLLLSFMVLTACGGVVETEPTATPPVRATDQPAYPSPGEALPKPTSAPSPEGYPAAPETAATLPAGYPGTATWIVLPAGLQCEDKAYPTLEAAEATLVEAGIEILQSEQVNLAVCEACGCPTSEHYRVQIDPADLEEAIELGWRPE